MVVSASDILHSAGFATGGERRRRAEQQGCQRGEDRTRHGADQSNSLDKARFSRLAPVAAMIGVGSQQRHHRGRLGEHHLLQRRGHLAPARRLLQRRGGAGAVAHVRHGDLHGVFVHLDILMAEDLGADDRVLHEVLRHAAADHQQARGARLDLDVGQLAEVGDGVDAS